MTYLEISEKFAFPLPEYAKSYFDAFIAEYDRSRSILSEEDAILVAETTKICEEAKECLISCAKAIDACDDAHICASFLAELTIYKRAPWLNDIYRDELFKVEGLHKEQVGWVLVAAMLANTLKNKLPPKDLNEENINAFRGYTQNCYGTYGYWGIVEWHWNMLCASGSMFLFGILKFVPSEWSGDYVVVTNGSRYISLAGGEYFVGKEGELVDCEEKSVGKTSFYEDDGKYVGNVVSARGVISLEKTELDKSEWKDFLRAGDHTMSLHIPANVEYTPERFKEAFYMALDFYKGYYPDHKVKAMICFSWILSAQLPKVMPVDSKILRVNDSTHLLPIVGTYDENIMFVRKGSGLYNRIAEERAKGTEFHYGMMYVPLDEIETFGKKTV